MAMNKAIFVLLVVLISLTSFVAAEYPMGTFGSEALIYHFDDCSTCQPLDSSGNNRNGTWFNGAASFVDSDCAPIAGNTGCANMSADPDLGIEFPNTTVVHNYGDWTINIWMKTYVAVDRYGLMTSKEWDTAVVPSAGQKFLVYLNDGTARKYAQSDIIFGSWYMYTQTYNDAADNYTIYINGTQKASFTSINTFSCGAIGTCTYNVIGHWNKAVGGTTSFPGIVDDLVILGKTLTLEQVQQMYTDSYTPADATPPQVIIATNNTAPKYNANISVYVNSTEAGNCWVYNNMSNTNSSSIACNATFTYIVNLTKSNSIFFRAYATDGAGNLNSTETLTLNVANSPPPATGNFNVSNDYTASTNETINFTAVTDADGDTVNYYVWWNDTTLRRIINTTTNKFTLNLTAQGVFYYWVETFDGTTSGGNSSIQKLTADFTPPTITWTSPSAATTYTLNPTYPINVTCSDNYEIWSMNISLYNSSNAQTTSYYFKNVSVASFNNYSVMNLNLYQKNIISVRCYDSHTAELIPDLRKSKLNDTLLVFNDIKKNEYLNIVPSLISSIDKSISLPTGFTSSIDYIDEYDRVTIDTAKATKIKLSNTFKIENKGNKIIYRMTGNKKLNYLPQSKYAGHVVWGTYVTDFDSARYVYVNGLKSPSIIQVKIINDYNIDVIVSGLLEWQAGDVITIDPETQGLNWAEQNRTIEQISYPYWDNILNNASTTTGLNGYINWSVKAYDRDNYFFLSSIDFYHNSTGSWQSISKSIFGLNSVFINVTTQITAPHYVCGYFIVTDRYSLTNTTDYSCANITNSNPTAPMLSLPANNSIEYINVTTFDWTDSTDADGDIISYNLYISNQTDIGYIVFNKTGLASSTYTLISAQSLANGRYYWKVNSTDDHSGYSANSVIYTYIVNISFGISAHTKNCTTCYAGQDVVFNCTINGGDLLDDIIFSENSTGAWVNYTSGFVNSSTDWFSYTINGSNYQRFESIGWYWIANSTDGRVSTGTLQVFNISNHLPTQSTPTINLTNSSNLILSNLTCNPVGVEDLDSDSVTLSYAWYKNNVLQSAFNNLQKLSYDNTTEDEIWNCEVAIYDGYNNGITKNSSGIEILSYAPNDNYLFMYPRTNYTFIVNIPRYSYISNLSFYLGSYNSTDICFQESTNKSSQCEFFTTYDGGSTTYGTNSTPYPNSGTDDNHSTYISGYNPTFKSYGMIEEYKVPIVPLILELDTGNAPIHCRKNISVTTEYIVNNSFYLNIVYLDFSVSLIFFGYNGTAWNTLYNTFSNPCGTGNTYDLYETAIYLNLTSPGITNLSINTFDAKPIYFNDTLWTNGQKYLIYSNITTLNDILMHGCDCVGCVFQYPNCSIPLNFTSLTTGRLKIYYYNTSIDFELNNCTGSSIPTNATALNITFYDQTGTVDEIVYEATTFYTIGTITKNFSMATDSTSNVAYCIYPNWAHIIIDQHHNYFDGTNYYNYYMSDNEFINVTQQLNLYTHNGTTQVLFTVQDKNSDAIAGAYLHILVYDVGTGTYKTTEILQTDTKGQALGNIVLYNTFYTFLIYYNGELIYSENGVRIVANTRTFTISLAGTSWTDDFVVSDTITSNLYFNNETNNFVFTYSDGSSKMHYGCLKVDKINRTGKYNLSDDCVYSASGSVIASITPSNDTTYIATGYIKFDNEFIKQVLDVVFNKSKAFFSTDQPELMLFLSILIWITLMLIGLPHPAISMVLFAIGIVVTSIMHFYLISASMLFGIIILAVIQIYLHGSRQ
jgi:hypothetical protein